MLTLISYNPLNNEEIRKMKRAQRPENKSFVDKPHERDSFGGERRSTRPWDNCWFSNKPHIINLTVEEAINQYPNYIMWCYKNLRIKWSVYTIRLIESKCSL